MPAFNKSLFRTDGGYLTYDGQFVARFKHQKQTAACAFAAFLVKHFTVEEYFNRRAAGEAPLPIVESKGFVLPHMKVWLKQEGLPQTQAGVRRMIERRVAQSLQYLAGRP